MIRYLNGFTLAAAERPPSSGQQNCLQQRLDGRSAGGAEVAGAEGAECVAWLEVARLFWVAPSRLHVKI
jgi:hypothetical protein